MRIAIVKYGGLSAGGTEKFLQNLAVGLARRGVWVDYFFCEPGADIDGPEIALGTDHQRAEWLRAEGVHLREFRVEKRQMRSRTLRWQGTDFWDVFDAGLYDLIQTGRGGHPEYPFTEIRDIPIVDSLHLDTRVDHQKNISKVLLLSEWSRRQWIRSGGQEEKSVVISHPILDLSRLEPQRSRSQSAVEPARLVIGMHQRPNDEIFSPVLLKAANQLPRSQVEVRILGGSSKYHEQSRELGMSNVTFKPFSPVAGDIADFLSGLDVYAHARWDGEINSTAIAEALSFGLPVVSHKSHVANGHRDVVSNCGIWAESLSDYRAALEAYLEDSDLRKIDGDKSRKFFDATYSFDEQVDRILDIYKEVIESPIERRGGLAVHRRALRGTLYRAGLRATFPVREELSRRRFSS